MTDQWVRNPDQTSLDEAQAIVDAQPRPDIVVRHYPGVPQQAASDFKIDAAQMIAAGWHPVSVAYVADQLDAASVFALGSLATAKVMGGTLVATYRYQRPGSTPDAAPADPGAQG